MATHDDDSATHPHRRSTANELDRFHIRFAADDSGGVRVRKGRSTWVVRLVEGSDEAEREDWNGESIARWEVRGQVTLAVRRRTYVSVTQGCSKPHERFTRTERLDGQCVADSDHPRGAASFDSLNHGSSG